MGLFKSLLELTEDVVAIATAPIEVAVDVARAATKPVADAAKEITAEMRDAMGVDDE